MPCPPEIKECFFSEIKKSLAPTSYGAATRDFFIIAIHPEGIVEKTIVEKRYLQNLTKMPKCKLIRELDSFNKDKVIYHRLTKDIEGFLPKAIIGRPEEVPQLFSEKMGKPDIAWLEKLNRTSSNPLDISYSLLAYSMTGCLPDSPGRDTLLKELRRL